MKLAVVALLATLSVSSASAAPRGFVQVVDGLDSPTDVRATSLEGSLYKLTG